MTLGSRTGYLFVAFPLAAITLFTLVPTAAGVLASLFDWNGIGRPRFVGPANFIALFDPSVDPLFWRSVANTVAFALITTPIATIAGFLLALPASADWFVGRTLVRACLFLPTIISIVAVGVLWRWLLSDEIGPVPNALRAIGLRPPNFLQDGLWPMASIMAVQVWRGVGFAFVLYLAAFSGVDRSLTEAAAVDGATGWRSVWHVSRPQVRPTTAFLLITGVIGSLQVFDIVLAMTAQAVSGTTIVLNYSIYDEFRQSRLGYASAIGVVIFALSAALTAAQARLLRERSA